MLHVLVSLIQKSETGDEPVAYLFLAIEKEIPKKTLCKTLISEFLPVLLCSTASSNAFFPEVEKTWIQFIQRGDSTWQCFLQRAGAGTCLWTLCPPLVHTLVQWSVLTMAKAANA